MKVKGGNMKTNYFTDNNNVYEKKMKYADNIFETIGHTPLIKIRAAHLKPLILAKMESFNPGGSVKDRIGIRMLLEAERNNLLKKGGTVVEPTSGNTGVGLAMVSAIRGYRMIFIMPNKMSIEKELLLRAYGAEVIRTPTNVAPEDPRSYYQVAKRLVSEIPGAFSPNQYANQNNPQAHYETTGPEIWEDTCGEITHFVAGIGTGGTISGIAKFLKEKKGSIKIIGADPFGSLYFHTFYGKKGAVHTYNVEGIGRDFIPTTTNLSLIDEIIQVSDKDAFLTTRRLAMNEGIFVGGSSGAALFVAMKIAEGLDENSKIVVLFPDTGRNYLSTIFNDEWMKKNNFL